MIKLFDVLTDPRDRDGTNDVTTKVQAVFDTLLTTSRSGGGNELYLQSGSFRIDAATLQVGIKDTTDQGGAFFRIVGDDPSLCTFFTTVNHRIMQVNNMWGGTLEGFTVRGPGKGLGEGLVLANIRADLGTNNVILKHVNAANLRAGIQSGDQNDPQGAAAELLFQECSASNCNQGFPSGQWNSLDLNYDVCHASDCNYGWITSLPKGGSGQIKWSGGSTSKNALADFAL